MTNSYSSICHQSKQLCLAGLQSLKDETNMSFLLILL